MVIVAESGMAFGPFEDDTFCYIEKTEYFRGVNRGAAGIKIAEFILIREDDGKPVVWIVEAQSSVPRLGDAGEGEGYFDSIKEKMENALSMTASAWLGWNNKLRSELSGKIANLDLSEASFRFVLVIKGCPKEYIGVVKEKLENKLSKTCRVWSLGPSPVAVLNDSQAISHGIVSRVL